jgi:hypothetical protein
MAKHPLDQEWGRMHSAHDALVRECAAREQEYIALQALVIAANARFCEAARAVDQSKHDMIEWAVATLDQE